MNSVRTMTRLHIKKEKKYWVTQIDLTIFEPDTPCVHVQITGIVSFSHYSVTLSLSDPNKTKQTKHKPT